MILEKLLKSYQRILTNSACFPNGTPRKNLIHSELGERPPLLVLHDLETLSVFYVNNLARDSFGFEGNWLISDGISRYVKLLHPDSVYTLVESYHFFRRQETGFLNQSLQMRFERGYQSLLSTTKTIAWSDTGKPRYALTLLSKVSQLKDLEVYSLEGLDCLKPRQLEVLSFMLKGHSNGEIGAELGISPRTVEKHVKLILEATGCQSRIALVQAVH